MTSKFTYPCLLLLLLLCQLNNVTAQTINVTLNVKAGQEGRTKSPVVFVAVFNVPINVATFTTGSIVLTGSATNKVVSSITQVSPNNGTTFEILVTASNNGTVKAIIPQAIYSTIIFAKTGNSPRSITIDGSGNLYTANYNDNNVSKITPNGTSIILGRTGPKPSGITIDMAGNIYTCNSGDSTISQITPDGAYSILSGHTGRGPADITIDGYGNLYTANLNSNNVTQITYDGVFSIFGTTGIKPASIKVDGSGNVFTANYGDNTVTKITADGTSILFGTTGANPQGLTIDGLGNVYTANYTSNTVTKISPSGQTTLNFSQTASGPVSIITDGAGNVFTANYTGNNISIMNSSGSYRFYNGGNTDFYPWGITIDGSGNIYIPSSFSSTITKLVPPPYGIAPAGSTFAFNAGSNSTNNIYTLSLNVTINKKVGQENQSTSPVLFTAIFSEPINVASFTAASIALSGTATGKAISSIIQVSPNDGTSFEITAIASNNGTIMATIPAAVSILGTSGSQPSGIVIDGSGNIYTANKNNNNVSKITQAGVSTIFGNTGAGPSALAMDAAGNVFTANSGDNTVSKITAGGTSITAFGTTGATPFRMTIDGSGNLYTANYSSNNLSKITPAGLSSIFSNNQTITLDITSDGVGNIYIANNDKTVYKITPDGTLSFKGYSPFYNPYIKLDGSGNIYIACDNYTVTKITTAGVTTTLGNTGITPKAITIDGSGNVYVANSGDNTVSKISPAGVSTILGSTGASPSGIAIDGLGNVYTANLGSNNVTKFSSSGISLAGLATPSNSASTSTSSMYTLPVSLLYFTETNTNCTATFFWKTVTEVNSSYYAIEYSDDGVVFTVAAKIFSKNILTGAAYQFTLSDITASTKYYRLKSADIDGKYTYSKTITITTNEICDAGVQIKVSPNPAKNYITVEGVVKGSRIMLLTASGIRLIAMEATGTTQYIDINKYAKGIYLLRTEAANGSMQTVKVVHQ